MAKILPFNKGENSMGRDNKTSVFDVAEYFLSQVEEDSGSVMTHLKLQKLCYYAQAWHLVFEGEPMFSESFEAWAHGPACPELWYKYKSYGYSAIDIPEHFTFNFTESELATLDAVWEAYGQFDGKYLERLTHQEDPWKDARGTCLPGEYCNKIISLESMKEYYSRLKNG